MDGYKHYIRVDSNNLVIYGFSNAFEEPQPTDIPLSGEHGRHFTIQLLDDSGLPLYKVVNGQMVLRDKTEIESSVEYKQKLRQEINDRWDIKIAKAREDLRRVQDERKTQATSDKFYNTLKGLIAERNTELAGVV